MRLTAGPAWPSDNGTLWSGWHNMGILLNWLFALIGLLWFLLYSLCH